MIHICIIARMIIMPQTNVFGFFVHYNTFVGGHGRSYLLFSDLTGEYNSTSIRVNHFYIVSLLSYSVQTILVTFFDHFRAATTITTYFFRWTQHTLSPRVLMQSMLPLMLFVGMTQSFRFWPYFLSPIQFLSFYFPFPLAIQNHSICLRKQTRFSIIVHPLLLFPHFLLLLLKLRF